jgi:D-tyrosyl-tRNA(Tyr) deacylase
MRAVIQRVRTASVSVDGRITGAIDRGLLVFVGIEAADTGHDVDWLAGKIPSIRCFEDTAGKMNRSVRDIDGGILAISQFTLFGSLKKGTRPSFNRAAVPESATRTYQAFVERLGAALGRPVETGVFGAMMEIDARHDGPVTLVVDTKYRDF